MVPAPALGFRSVLAPGAKRAERTELTADWMIDHARSKSCRLALATIPGPVRVLPAPGGENAWFATLPAALRERLGFVASEN
jgi:hypothetical protein